MFGFLKISLFLFPISASAIATSVVCELSKTSNNTNTTSLNSTHNENEIKISTLSKDFQSNETIIELSKNNSEVIKKELEKLTTEIEQLENEISMYEKATNLTTTPVKSVPDISTLQNTYDAAKSTVDDLKKQLQQEDDKVSEAEKTLVQKHLSKLTSEKALDKHNDDLKNLKTQKNGIEISHEKIKRTIYNNNNTITATQNTINNSPITQTLKSMIDKHSQNLFYISSSESSDLTKWNNYTSFLPQTAYLFDDSYKSINDTSVKKKISDEIDNITTSNPEFKQHKQTVIDLNKQNESLQQESDSFDNLKTSLDSKIKDLKSKTQSITDEKTKAEGDYDKDKKTLDDLKIQQQKLSDSLKDATKNFNEAELNLNSNKFLSEQISQEQQKMSDDISSKNSIKQGLNDKLSKLRQKMNEKTKLQQDELNQLKTYENKREVIKEQIAKLKNS